MELKMKKSELLIYVSQTMTDVLTASTILVQQSVNLKTN